MEQHATVVEHLLQRVENAARQVECMRRGAYVQVSEEMVLAMREVEDRIREYGEREVRRILEDGQRRVANLKRSALFPYESTTAPSATAPSATAPSVANASATGTEAVEAARTTRQTARPSPGPGLGSSRRPGPGLMPGPGPKTGPRTVAAPKKRPPIQRVDSRRKRTRRAFASWCTRSDVAFETDLVLCGPALDVPRPPPRPAPDAVPTVRIALEDVVEVQEEVPEELVFGDARDASRSDRVGEAVVDRGGEAVVDRGGEAVADSNANEDPGAGGIDPASAPTHVAQSQGQGQGQEQEHVPVAHVQAEAVQFRQPQEFPCGRPRFRHRSWNYYVAMLRRYAHLHGHASPPLNAPREWQDLVRWVVRVRDHRRLDKVRDGEMPAYLTDRQVDQLDAVNFDWKEDEISMTWEGHFARLRQFVQNHGHADVPPTYSAPGCGKTYPCLGKWLQYQKTAWVNEIALLNGLRPVTTYRIGFGRREKLRRLGVSISPATLGRGGAEDATTLGQTAGPNAPHWAAPFVFNAATGRNDGPDSACSNDSTDSACSNDSTDSACSTDTADSGGECTDSSAGAAVSGAEECTAPNTVLALE